MSTLFSFVTVRNPRTPTNEEVDTGFIRYDETTKAPVLEAAVEARSQAPGALRRTLLKAKKADERIFKDEAAMIAQLPGLTHFAQWLSHHVDAVTWAQIDERRSHYDVEVDREALSLLWDNLAVLTYAGGPPEVRELVIWALRVSHLLSKEGIGDLSVEEHRDDELARRMALATPLIPTGLHGPTHLERMPPVDDTKDDTEKDRGDSAEDEPAFSKQERLQRLEHAHAEMTEQLRRAREMGRSETVLPPFVPRIAAGGCMEDFENQEAAPTRLTNMGFTESVKQSLSTETLEVLEDLPVDADQSLTAVLDQIAGAAQRLGTEVAGTTVGGLRVAQVGGSFWVKGAAESATASKERAYIVPDHRTEYTYQKFWGRDRTPPSNRDEARCRVRPLGVGDFRRVEQRICCNRPAEVAHIENVLKGETKERTTEHRTTVESFTSVITDEERTTERDSQTTDRYEMEKEVNKAIESDTSFEIGVNVAAQYGPVKITADTKFATSQASKESDKQAVRYAQEVTDKTLERVVTKVREERSTRTLEEYTETNLHRLQATDDHVVGLYRWVEKVYEAKVINYGKRLMFEFLIPEPAAFHLHAMSETQNDAATGLIKPVDPRSSDTRTAFNREPIVSHSDITETNYAFWAATYDASVEPPPALQLTTSKSYARADMDQNVQFADSKSDLAMPAGYEANWFDAIYGLHSETHNGGANWITIMVGRQSRFATSAGSFGSVLHGEDDVVPVAVLGRTRMYGVNVEVQCLRTVRAFETWRQKTFRAILDGYASKLAAYETALAQAQTQAGVQIRGTNPALNRQTEATELEKGCLRLFTSCARLTIDAMQENGDEGYPDFDCCTAIRDGNIAQFFEQLFEWRLMTYAFYPYFWGRKSKWAEIYRLDDVDPLFLSFLKAGYARVVVPVRPGYEGAALRYLADGMIWDGGSAPGVDDPMYVAIENDLKEPVGVVDPSIEPWDIVVPTSLTVLQCNSGCVPGTGLPCPCEDEENNREPDDESEHNDGGVS